MATTVICTLSLQNAPPISTTTLAIVVGYSVPTNIVIPAPGGADTTVSEPASECPPHSELVYRLLLDNTPKPTHSPSFTISFNSHEPESQIELRLPVHTPTR